MTYRLACLRIIIVALTFVVFDSEIGTAQSRSLSSTRKYEDNSPRCEKSYNVYNDYSINKYYGQPYYSKQRFPNDRYYDYYGNNYYGSRRNYEQSYAPGFGSSSFYDAKAKANSTSEQRHRYLGYSGQR